MAAEFISHLLETLPSFRDQHMRTSAVYGMIDSFAGKEINASRFTLTEDGSEVLGRFGKVVFPFIKMGSITSLDLFGLDELIIFSFYLRNSVNYSQVADFGANIGLHSLMMAKLGWKVDAYEPDPQHISVLNSTLHQNEIEGNVSVFDCAISNEATIVEFVRVVGNSTGSHIAGAKSNPYGELINFPVKTESIGNLVGRYDLIKMDVEGQEAKIIGSTTRTFWEETDMILEVGNGSNAELIFEHLRSLEVSAYSQKVGWNRVKDISDLPMSHREGSLFISLKDEMPW